ncbi:MAG TPA: hypothetical protein PLY95_03530 [Candidatus Paceibacterota bacterium]|nr:hypothetical protein [Candidatus Paceibacterota bacterium]
MIIEIDERRSVKIEEYNGNYSLVAMYNGFPQWAKYQIGKDKYADKARPVKVDLGDQAMAILHLTAAINVIKGNTEETPF